MRPLADDVCNACSCSAVGFIEVLGVLVSGLLLSAADLFNASDVQSSAADGLVVADGLPSS